MLSLQIDELSQQEKELIVHLVEVAISQLLKGLIVVHGCEQIVDQVQPCSLKLLHLSGKALGFQDHLHQALIAECRLGLEQVGLAFFRRQGIHQRIHQASDRSLLFFGFEPQLGRNVGHQQGLGRVMVDDGRAQEAAGAALRAHGAIQFSTQELLLELWFLTDIDDRMDVHHKGRLAIGATYLAWNGRERHSQTP